jgi:dihydroorotate dehydrogenase electron transfer subunit
MVCDAVQETAGVVEQVALARDTFRLRLRCPGIARRIVPGQFFMVRCPDRTDPLLGRPFALYDTWLDDAGRPAGIDFVYHVIGKVTGLLSRWRSGECLELWGPLGNGFPSFGGVHLICVGGGIGYTPFLAVARETLGQREYGATQSGRSESGREPRASGRVHPAQPSTLDSPLSTRRVTLLYGVRSRDVRADLSDFDTLPGFEARIATDDGSEGRRGLVTDLLVESLAGRDAGARPDAVYCCGPEAMMHATARLCARHGVPCWLSLESPMACGFGACFSCVTRVRTADAPGWDYRRTCVEGPVFPAETLWLE